MNIRNGAVKIKKNKNTRHKKIHENTGRLQKYRNLIYRIYRTGRNTARPTKLCCFKYDNQIVLTLCYENVSTNNREDSNKLSLKLRRKHFSVRLCVQTILCWLSSMSSTSFKSSVQCCRLDPVTKWPYH